MPRLRSGLNLPARWLAGAVALAGCSPAVDRKPASEPVAAQGPAVQVPLLPPSNEGDAALTVGTLVREGPCLYLRGSDGRLTMPAFLTVATRWQDGALLVGTRRFAPGDQVALGGGGYSGSAAALPWVQPPDPSCKPVPMWITITVDSTRRLGDQD